MPACKLLPPARLVLASVLGMLFGCLPEGEPPRGRQLIHDRAVNGAFFSQSGIDPGRSHLLVSGPTRSSPIVQDSGGGWYTSELSDLYWIDVSDTTSPPFPLEHAQPVLRNLTSTATSLLYNELPRDSRGRLLLETLDVDKLSVTIVTLNRFDPDSQTIEHLLDYRAGNWGGALTFSPKHTRVLFYEGASDSTLIDLDGKQDIDGTYPSFVGEDVYYVAGMAQPGTSPKDTSLARIRTGSSKEVFFPQQGLMHFQSIDGTEPPLLLLWAQAPVQDAIATYLFDTATSAITPLPLGTSLVAQSASSNGRWILFSGLSEHWAVYDRTTGEMRPLGDQDADQTRSAEWRPGTEQLWVQLSDSITIWTPDGSVTVQGSSTTSCLGDFRYRSSMFNSDGSLWFSAISTGFEMGRLSVGQADDLEQAPRPVHPEGTQVHRCWELDKHRLLVEAYLGDSQDADLYLFDPATGESRPLAGNAKMVQPGANRVLALLQWENWRSAGQLALIDYATGARTRLGNDVAQAIVDTAGADILSGADPLAPGAHVALISRNRLDSPYDGLWLAELP